MARLIAQVNQMISSRERFRAANQALRNYSSHMDKYDRLILQFLGELIEAIDAVEPVLVPPESKRMLWRPPND